MVKFSISDPSYGFPTRWDAAQVATAQDMIRTAVKGHISANKLYADLRSANLGYRKTNVFRDLAFAKATEFSQTVAAFDRASKWFETIESINKEMGYNDRRRAIEFFTKWKYGSEMTESEAQQAKDIDLVEIYARLA